MLSVRQPNPPPEPGQYDGVDPKVYHSWAAYNASTLCEGVDRPPAYIKAYLDAPAPKPTKDMRIGSGVHTATLEPDAFAGRYVARPEGLDRRTKEGKAIWADLCLRHGQDKILDADELETILACQKAIWAHDEARGLIIHPKGASEVSYVWRDPETGLLCKMRLDRAIPIEPKHLIVDIKTTTDLRAESFERSILDFNYHVRGAYYIDGYRACTGQDADFAMIVVEKGAPNGVMVYVLDEASIELGRRKYRQSLNAAAQCEHAGLWPSYPLGPRKIGVPTYVLMREQDDVQAGAA